MFYDKISLGDSMKNCFLIVNYNDFKSTKHLIENIKSYNCLSEIVVVDNYSNELEIELLSTMEIPNVHVIYNEANLGYSGAINVGAFYLIDKYKKCNIIVSNSDIVIMSEQDLVRLINLLDEPSIGLVGPQILERGQILKGQKDCTINYEIMNNIPLLRLFMNKNHLNYCESYYNSPYSLVDVISTSFFLIASETLKRINFMDEKVFLYYEDFILSSKVRQLSLEVVVANDVKIKHLYSVSVNKSFNDKDKKRILRDSQFYYHTTYHKINGIQKRLLKWSLDMMVLFARKR